MEAKSTKFLRRKILYGTAYSPPRGVRGGLTTNIIKYSI
jgi:hypothetical protein